MIEFTVYQTTTFQICFTLFTKHKCLDWSKFKAFAKDKKNVNEKLKFVLGKVENIEGKGENHHHFLFFLQCYQKASISRLLKVRIVRYRVEMKATANHISVWLK